MASHRYLRIRSKINGLVMGLEGGASKPGTSVVNQSQVDGNCDHQLWYEDSGTLRSKSNNLCLDFDDSDNLIVASYSPGRSRQQWGTSGDYVENSTEDRVVDLAENDDSDGARLVAWFKHGEDNQLWNIEPVDIPVRYFFIKSLMHGKVLDVSGWDDGQPPPNPGQKIISFRQKAGCADNQLWYEDRAGIVRSKLADYCIDSSDEGEVCVGVYDSSVSAHQWIVSGKTVVNRTQPNKCLDIKKKNRFNRATIIAYDYQGQSNQEWEYEYIN